MNHIINICWQCHKVLHFLNSFDPNETLKSALFWFYKWEIWGTEKTRYLAVGHTAIKRGEAGIQSQSSTPNHHLYIINNLF